MLNSIISKQKFKLANLTNLDESEKPQFNREMNILGLLENSPNKVQSLTLLVSTINMITVIDYFNNNIFFVNQNLANLNLSKDHILTYMEAAFTELTVSDVEYIYTISCHANSLEDQNRTIDKPKRTPAAEIFYNEIISYLTQTQLSSSDFENIISIEEWHIFFNGNFTAEDHYGIGNKCNQIIMLIKDLNQVKKILLPSISNLIIAAALQNQTVNRNLQSFFNCNFEDDKLKVYNLIIKYLISIGFSFDLAFNLLQTTMKEYLAKIENYDKSIINHPLGREMWPLKRQVNFLEENWDFLKRNNIFLKEPGSEINKKIDSQNIFLITSLVEKDTIISSLYGNLDGKHQCIDCIILFLQVKLLREEAATMLMANLEVLLKWVSNAPTASEKQARYEASNRIIASIFNRNTSLRLNSLNLSEIPPLEHLIGLEHITHLDLDFNSFVELREKCFVKLTNLSSLHLDGNNISHLNSETFMTNNQLTTIRLSRNKITSLSKELFDHITYLANLFLENNKIENLPDGGFATFNGFFNLSLKNNPIQNIPLSAFNPTMQKLIRLLGIDNFVELKISDDMINDVYLFNDNLDEISFIEEYCLLKIFILKPGGGLWLSREVEYKLLSRIAAGQVNLSETNLGIDFWCNCLKDNHMSLKYMIFKNVDFFLQKDGKEKLLSVITNNLLYLPVNQPSLEVAALIEFMVNMKRLITNLYLAKSTSEVAQVKIDWFQYNIKNFVDKIKKDEENLVDKERHLGFLVEKIMVFIMQEIEISNSDSDEVIKEYPYILMNSRIKITEIIYRHMLIDSFDHKAAISKHLFKQIKYDYLEDVKQVKVKEKVEGFIAKLENVIDSFNYEFRDKNYHDILRKSFPGISDCSADAKKAISKEVAVYSSKINRLNTSKSNSWQAIVNNAYKELIQLLAGENNLKIKYPELFYAYLISMLPFLKPNEIAHFIENSSDIPLNMLELLKLVIMYCQVLGIADDSKQASGIIPINSDSGYKLLCLNDIGLLNPVNRKKIAVNSLSIIELDRNLYEYLVALATSESEYIDLTKGGKYSNKLSKQIAQLQAAHILSSHMAAKLIESNGQLKIIKKSDLLEVINSTHEHDWFVWHSFPISLMNFNQLEIPEYLKTILFKNITVANYLGPVIFKFIDNRFKLNEVINLEKKRELEKIVINMVIQPDSRQDIELGFKQELMRLLKEDEFYKNKLQESAIKISNQVVNLEGAKKYNSLPGFVIAEFLDDSIKNFVDEIIQVLNDVANLRNIHDYKVNYLLGYLFINLSSESILGYDYMDPETKQIDNRAFAQLRILGALLLSLAVKQGNRYLSDSTQTFIGKIIHDLVLSPSCSNVCAVQLYNNQDIGYVIKEVLGEKLSLDLKKIIM